MYVDGMLTFCLLRLAPSKLSNALVDALGWYGALLGKEWIACPITSMTLQ